MKLMIARASWSSLTLVMLLAASPGAQGWWNTGTMIDGPVGEPVYIIPPCVNVDITIDGERFAATFPPNCFMVAPVELVWDSSLAQRRATGLIVYNTSADELVGETALFSLATDLRDLAPLAKFIAWLWPAPEPAPVTLLFEGLPEGVGQQTVSVRAAWEVTWEGDDCRSARGDITVEFQGVRTPPAALQPLLMEACRVATTSSFLPARAPAPADVAAFSLQVLSEAPRSAGLEPVMSTLTEIAGPEALAGGLELSMPLIEIPRAEPLAHGSMALPAGMSAANSIAIGPPNASDPAWQSAGNAEAIMGPGLRDVHVAETLAAKSPIVAFEQSSNETLARSQETHLERSHAIAHDALGPREPPPAQNASVPIDAVDPRALSGTGSPPTMPTTGPPPSTSRPEPAPARPVVHLIPATPPGPHLLAVVLAAGAVAMAWCAFALYQRVARPSGLEHEGRRALHAACTTRATPLTAGELAAACDLERKTAEYHLVYLVRLGILRAHEAPDEPRRYSLPAVPRAPAAEPVDERLIAALRERPRQSTADLAASIGITRWRVERRMRDLTLDGRARSMRADGVRRYEAA